MKQTSQILLPLVELVSNSTRVGKSMASIAVSN